MATGGSLDREWAALLLRQALDRLTKECALAGKADLLSHLMPYLSPRKNRLFRTNRWHNKRIARSLHCAAMLPDCASVIARSYAKSCAIRCLKPKTWTKNCDICAKS